MSLYFSRLARRAGLQRNASSSPVSGSQPGNLNAMQSAVDHNLEVHREVSVDSNVNLPVPPATSLMNNRSTERGAEPTRQSFEPARQSTQGHPLPAEQNVTFGDDSRSGIENVPSAYPAELYTGDDIASTQSSVEAESILPEMNNRLRQSDFTESTVEPEPLISTESTETSRLSSAISQPVLSSDWFGTKPEIPRQREDFGKTGVEKEIPENSVEIKVAHAEIPDPRQIERTKNPSGETSNAVDGVNNAADRPRLTQPVKSRSENSLQTPAAPRSNRVEVRIGKIDISVHQQKPAPVPAHAKKTSPQNSREKTNQPNNLSRYYLKV